MSLKEAYNFKKPADCPDWLKPFFNNKYKYLNSGGYKHVFSNGKYAISVEKYDPFLDKEIKEVFQVLRTIEKPFSEHIIVPLKQYKSRFIVRPTVMKVASMQPLKYVYAEETKFVEEESIEVLFSLMNLCPHGDYFDKFANDGYNIDERQIVELGLALKHLHQKGIYVSDLKAENIAHCTCDCLAFIDLDRAIVPSDFDNGILVKRATVQPWWNPMYQFLVKGETITKDICAFNDWFAFAIVYILHCIKVEEIPKQWADQFNQQYSVLPYGTFGAIKYKEKFFKVENVKNEKLKQAMLLYMKGNLFFNVGLSYEEGVYEKFVDTLETIV